MTEGGPAQAVEEMDIDGEDTVGQQGAKGALSFESSAMAAALRDQFTQLRSDLQASLLSSPTRPLPSTSPDVYHNISDLLDDQLDRFKHHLDKSLTSRASQSASAAPAAFGLKERIVVRVDDVSSGHGGHDSPADSPTSAIVFLAAECGLLGLHQVS